MRKRILITGASSGLGAEMARSFAALGRDLALCARRSDRLQTLAEELRSSHPAIRVSLRVLDVAKYDDVFRVFREFSEEFGGLDRVIVNAGLGKGQPLGTGYFYANRETAETNFVGALAQCEAALEIFRRQNDGHLVTISSISAMRGMPRNMTTYAASKAALRSLTEGIRLDLQRTPIAVTALYPGYIRSEMNAKVKRARFMVDTEVGVRAMVRAIERETPEACVPRWPWAPIGFLMRNLPLSLVARLV